MRRAAALVMALVLASGIGIALAASTLWRPVLIESSRVYRVEQGTSATGLAFRLRSEGLVDVPGFVLRIYARLTEGSGFVRAGEYLVTPGMSTVDLFALFRSGKVYLRDITFPEGWTFREWRRHLAAQAYVTSTIDTMSDHDIMVSLGQGDVPAEGQFFPDTYHFERGETDLAILSRAHRAMIAKLDLAWRTRSSLGIPATEYDALILASIIEKESGYEPDRAKIAGVFVNRLRDRIRLQSDPTVIYGIDDFDGDLTRADLKAETPYNTYLNFGLPPTPICNPGISAIEAAMNPEIHNYYYFVARGDGSSEFSETLQEHNQAVIRYQKSGRVKSYRSSPEARSH
ncbi:MAG: endolytic transglycosylase MltG [Pseudomonadales bacterium]|nr:endolytic transglycosylase MltG [Pseudomonadales bacterium]